jgi:transcriptional regulator with XRE-family HTH domain
MIPTTLGKAIHEKRIALGLSQQQLADMAQLSRQSLNGIELGTVNATLETLGRLLDVLGLTLAVMDPEAARREQGKPTRALWMAVKGANVSYVGEFTAEDLEQALATGDVPVDHQAQLAQVLDEAPIQLVTKVVAEVAAKRQKKPAEIWRNLKRLAQSLTATRGGLWT